MSFGPIMRFTVNGLQVELAPLTKETMGEFVGLEHGGGLQCNSVHRYLGLQAAPALEDEHDWYEKIRQDRHVLIWGIWLINGDERVLIGNSSLTGIDREGHTRLIRQATSGSLIFRKEYWGRGIASAAHKARAWYAFQHLGLHRVKSAVIRANQGSRKALERAGYSFVYTERNEQYGEGKLHNMDCLECLNPLDLFWSQWWHGDRPTKAALAARARTREALAWAEQNVELA